MTHFPAKIAHFRAFFGEKKSAKSPSRDISSKTYRRQGRGIYFLQFNVNFSWTAKMFISKIFSSKIYVSSLYRRNPVIVGAYGTYIRG